MHKWQVFPEPVTNVKYLVIHDVNQHMMKRIYRPTCLIAILVAAVLQITTQEHTYKSQRETILADLNWYTAKTCLVIILMDDAIKYTYIWPLV